MGHSLTHPPTRACQTQRVGTLMTTMMVAQSQTMHSLVLMATISRRSRTRSRVQLQHAQRTTAAC